MTPFDREIYARTLWMEARGEGREGIRAVGHVIHNRFKSGRWFAGKTLAATCLMAEQFSCWNTRDRNRRPMAELADDDPTLNLCRTLVDDIVHGDADPTSGATHYHSTSMVQPPDWINGAEFTVQIGKHRFFKGVR